jgi:hypothetical protein
MFGALPSVSYTFSWTGASLSSVIGVLCTSFSLLFSFQGHNILSLGAHIILASHVSSRFGSLSLPTSRLTPFFHIELPAFTNKVWLLVCGVGCCENYTVMGQITLILNVH